MSIHHRAELLRFGELPEFVLSFAETVPVDCVESPGTCVYLPAEHRIKISVQALRRTDVSMLMHEIAHAWHYAKIKKTAGNPEAWDSWSAVSLRDQEIHNLFLARRNGEWTSVEGKTYNEMAVDSASGKQIEDWKLGELCKCRDVKHYAMCTPDEFFAVLSDMYWLGSDWPPFTNGGLKEFDPESYTLLTKLWWEDESVQSR